MSLERGEEQSLYVVTHPLLLELMMGVIQSSCQTYMNIMEAMMVVMGTVPQKHALTFYLHKLLLFAEMLKSPQTLVMRSKPAAVAERLLMGHVHSTDKPSSLLHAALLASFKMCIH